MPDYAGVPGLASTRQAIARWDVVPEQAVNGGTFEVGVLAFHLGGMDRVDFSVNGGAAVSVSTITTNPRTGVDEYWTAVDLSAEPAGWVTLDATAYPTNGVARTLSQIRVYNGSPSWPVLEYGAGTHIIGDPGSSAEGYLTIKAAAGVAKEDVIIVKRQRNPSNGNVYQHLTNMRFEGVTVQAFEDASATMVYGKGSQYKMWFDNCILDGRDINWRPAGNCTAYYTNTEIKGFQVGSDGNSSLIRNCLMHQIFEDLIRNPRLVVNVVARDSERPEGSSGHPDLFEIQPNDVDNAIIQGFDSLGVGGQGLYSSTVQNMAIVDSHIDNKTGITNADITCHLLGSHTNILIHNTTFVGNGTIREDFGFVADDFVWSRSVCTERAWPMAPTPYPMAGITYLELPGDPVAPTITNSPPDELRLEPYTFQYTASGDAPITWAVTSGTLPPGLSLSSGGVLSGTPTVAQQYAFTVTATNAAGSASQNKTILIVANDADHTLTGIAVLVDAIKVIRGMDTTTPTARNLKGITAGIDAILQNMAI